MQVTQTLNESFFTVLEQPRKLGNLEITEKIPNWVRCTVSLLEIKLL